MNATTKKQSKSKPAVEHEIEITNSGPLERFAFRTKPGWNKVLGENDSGKTQGVMPPVLIISGDPNASFVLRRGATEASIKLDGHPVMIPKRTNKNGDVELQVLNHSPIAHVISPGYESEDVNERHRLEEFLKLMPIPVTAENLHMLLDVQNPDGIEDVDAAIENVKDELIAANIEELSKPDKNIVDVKEWLRKQLNDWALKYEKSAEQSQGEINAHTKERPASLSKVTVEDADAEYREAVGNEREMRGSAEQRVAREKERAEIQATLGERPDIEVLTEHRQKLGHIQSELAAQIRAVEENLAAMRATYRERQERYEVAAKAVKDAEDAAVTWDRRKAILDSEITGATSQDVESASRRVQEAATALELARATAEYNQALLARESAQKAREAALKYAGLYRRLAQGLTSALSAVLDEAGVPGVGVNEKGWLCAKKRNGETETFQSLNFARRFEVAIDAWAAGTDLDGAIIGIPTQFYAELDPAMKEATERKWVEHNIHAVVAIPASGNLRVE